MYRTYLAYDEQTLARIENPEEAREAYLKLARRTAYPSHDRVYRRSLQREALETRELYGARPIVAGPPRWWR